MRYASMTTDDDYNMGLEFDALDDELKAEVRRLVEKVRRTGYAEGQPFRDGDIYAYQHPGGGIAWGVNGAPSGFNIARGVCKPRPKIV
jgi:hypothetical protein